MLPANPTSFDDLLSRFAWQIPERFNMGVACSDAPAARDPGAAAIVDWSGDEPVTLTFGELAEKSSRFAAALAGLGIRRGDRVALLVPQCAETVIAHLGIYKLGAIAVPMAVQFGPDAVGYRLALSGASAIVLDASGIGKLETVRDTVPNLKTVISLDAAEGAHDFHALIEASGPCPAADTGPDDPALMIFTSGTTGQPKGALHGHRVLLGHLPGVQLHHDLLPQPGDLFWTPADWAWAGGLLNALLPALSFGVPVVAARAPRFEADWALRLMERAGIRNVFMPPTALRMLATVENAGDYRLNLRTMGSAGESLGRETLLWFRETFGLTINEFYGQTECNLVIGSCDALGTVRPGTMGKAAPGHEVALLDEAGNPVAAGEQGEIAVRRPDPVMFLGYWNDPEATDRKFTGDWMLTGDQAIRDEDGFFHFVGRDDDIIISAGYRIGPSEIEDCLTSHPAVAMAAVIGKPHAIRGQLVKAYLVLNRDAAPGNTLKEDIRTFVKKRLSAHEYPREIEFVDEVPLTTTGKVIRRHFRERASAEPA